MNHSKDRKKRFVSLRTKAFRVILAGSLLLILASIAAGFLLNSYASLRHYKDDARHLIDTIMALEDSEYIEKIFRETNLMPSRSTRGTAS